MMLFGYSYDSLLMILFLMILCLRPGHYSSSIRLASTQNLHAQFRYW
jgi:hypothetical protein